MRFFVAGSGQFTLHLGDKVYDILCEQGDLIGVPDGTRHRFDMSEQPHFVAIRLFNNPALGGQFHRRSDRRTLPAHAACRRRRLIAANHQRIALRSACGRCYDDRAALRVRSWFPSTGLS